MCTVLLLASCQVFTDRPARLVDPGPGARMSLAAALKQATGRDVALAKDALTKTSILYLTVKERPAVNQGPRLGRVMVEPLRFDLVMRGRRCVLIDTRNQARYGLDHARCETD